jgi:DNA helicase II / ATP-dependent DNA helicase PcrA
MIQTSLPPPLTPMDLAAQLNPAQLEAVFATEGPVLVIAGAGSGKTRVIEYRVLNLVRAGVAPESVVLLTFTRRAAREMLVRASRNDARCAKIAGGTFHSFANGIIRRYAAVLGLNDSFTILDKGDAEEVVGRCAARLGLYDTKKRFPKKDTLQAVMSKATNQRASVAGVLARDYPHFVEYAEQVERVRERYMEFKVASQCLDYDDLLVYLLILLEQEPVRQQLSERFKYVMVDEYQDTNALQGDIIYLLAERHRNVMVVGDDAQSIYRFRGAYRENILNFPDRFPGCLVVKLEQNYRSTGPILGVANAVMEDMRRKYSKCLRTVRGEDGSTPQLMQFKDDQDEAEWIAERAKRSPGRGSPAVATGGALPLVVPVDRPPSGAEGAEHSIPGVRGDEVQRDRTRQGPSGSPEGAVEPAGRAGLEPRAPTAAGGGKRDGRPPRHPGRGGREHGGRGGRRSRYRVTVQGGR